MTILDFTKLCRQFGSDSRFCQGPGGNISIKKSSFEILIKASGCALANVSTTEGFVKVNTQKIESYIAKELYSTRVLGQQYDDELNYLIDSETISLPNKTNKSSIETAMHCYFQPKFVAHLHPIHLNILLCSEEGQSIANHIFGDASYNWVEFVPPGFYLAQKIAQKCDLTNEKMRLPILLANHGLIISGDKIDEIFALAQYFDSASLDFLGSKGLAVSFADWQKKWSFKKNLNEQHLFPDTVVFETSSPPSLVAESIFCASDFIEFAITLVGLTPRYISLLDCQYIKEMSREKYRQKIAREK